MVWHSSESSIQNREISFLAILEIIVAISLYWGIAFYYNFYLHIITSIFIVPFLLLKSDYSIKFVLDKFSKVFFNKKVFLFSKSNIKFDIFIFLLYFFTVHFLLLYLNKEVSFDTTILLSLTFFIPMIYLSDIFPIIFYAVVLKISATIKYFFIGIKNISLNWIDCCFIPDYAIEKVHS